MVTMCNDDAAVRQLK